MGTPRRPAGRRGRLIEAWQEGMAWQKARGSGVGVGQAGAMADQVGPGWTNGQKKDERLVSARLENSLNRATIMLC